MENASGTGLLNTLQATDAESGESVFVKQAPEFVAFLGPNGLPLTSARMQQEQLACSSTMELEYQYIIIHHILIYNLHS